MLTPISLKLWAVAGLWPLSLAFRMSLKGQGIRGAGSGIGVGAGVGVEGSPVSVSVVSVESVVVSGLVSGVVSLSPS